MWIATGIVAALLAVLTILGRRRRRGGDGTLPPGAATGDVLAETQAQARRLLGPTFGG